MAQTASFNPQSAWRCFDYVLSRRALSHFKKHLLESEFLPLLWKLAFFLGIRWAFVHVALFCVISWGWTGQNYTWHKRVVSEIKPVLRNLFLLRLRRFYFLSFWSIWKKPHRHLPFCETHLKILRDIVAQKTGSNFKPLQQRSALVYFPPRTVVANTYPCR